MLLNEERVGLCELFCVTCLVVQFLIKTEWYRSLQCIVQEILPSIPISVSVFAAWPIGMMELDRLPRKQRAHCDICRYLATSMSREENVVETAAIFY